MRSRNLLAAFFVVVMLGLGTVVVWRSRHRPTPPVKVSTDPPVHWSLASESEDRMSRKVIGLLLNDYQHPPSRLPETFVMSIAVHGANSHFSGPFVPSKYDKAMADHARMMLSQHVLLKDSKGHRVSLIYYLSRPSVHRDFRVTGIAPLYPQPTDST